MTFQPDIIVSWDISEKDIPTITITKIEYDPNIKKIVGHVIATINAGQSAAISINQLLSRYSADKEGEC